MEEQRAIGDILVRRGVLAPDVLETLYAQQREKEAPLVEVVVATQVATEAAVARALASSPPSRISAPGTPV